MRTMFVVEPDVAPDVVLGLRSVVVGPQVHLFVLDRSPEPLDEDVVAPGPLTVHADRNVVSLEEIDEVAVGELTALVRVEDLGASEHRDRLLYGINTEVGRERVEKTPGHDVAREPIHHREEIEKPAPHRDVRVSGPEESHLRALAEPDVNLSAHPAPITEPQMRSLLANAQIGESDATQCARPT